MGNDLLGFGLVDGILGAILLQLIQLLPYYLRLLGSVYSTYCSFADLLLFHIKLSRDNKL